jgi:hypothetical protein
VRRRLEPERCASLVNAQATLVGAAQVMALAGALPEFYALHVTDESAEGTTLADNGAGATPAATAAPAPAASAVPSVSGQPPIRPAPAEPEPPRFGRLESVQLRKYWRDEARDFTPWLAREENLTLLGEAIGMNLELVAVEPRSRASTRDRNPQGDRSPSDRARGR